MHWATFSEPAVMSKPTGFTLIEVLIALAVLGVGLLASLKTAQQSGLDTLATEDRALGALSADNLMVAIALRPELLTSASSGSSDCPQAGLQMQCRYTAQSTGHPQFKRLEVRVENRDGRVIASRFSIIRVRPR